MFQFLFLFLSISILFLVLNASAYLMLSGMAADHQIDYMVDASLFLIVIYSALSIISALAILRAYSVLSKCYRETSHEMDGLSESESATYLSNLTAINNYDVSCLRELWLVMKGDANKHAIAERIFEQKFKQS